MFFWGGKYFDLLSFFFFNLFLERGKDNVWLLLVHPLPGVGELACNPGMCPDQEVNQQCFGSQAHAQSTKPHQPGLRFTFFSMCCYGQTSVKVNTKTNIFTEAS